MTKEVPCRMQRYIDKAREVPYTLEELEILHGMLNGDPNHEDLWMDMFTLKNGLMDVSREYEDGVPRQQLNLMQFLLVYHRRIFLFLMCVNLDQVLKYMDDLKPFVEWRIRIGK